MVFTAFLAAVAIIAAGIASVTGFGIGSLLTPTLAMAVGTKLAVAAISIPHLVGTAQRFWRLRAHVHRPILWGFGIASAVGGLSGALVHTWISSRTLSIVFGVVVALAGVSELTGWMRRVRWGRRSAWIAGAASGALGGMVGNQGGIRTAALLGFDAPKESFVATSTAIGLFVDAARMPVYLTTEWHEIARISSLVMIATLGVIVGTAVGTRVLTRVPEQLFRRVIAVLLIVLGGYMTFSNRS
ncbi:MAG TPA: sulfite exporter TauE/SafE family protein [Gemmatimonadaceae bacterium]|nr:sulfite exporter TauE/SafE family protein [Gemmatimonadaceae bacterium]